MKLHEFKKQTERLKKGDAVCIKVKEYKMCGNGNCKKHGGEIYLGKLKIVEDKSITIFIEKDNVYYGWYQKIEYIKKLN